MNQRFAVAAIVATLSSLAVALQASADPAAAVLEASDGVPEAAAEGAADAGDDGDAAALEAEMATLAKPGFFRILMYRF